ncbi:MAG: hypothetical protein KKH98_11375, partial [Spirochaetes bacterium]|nr:hypothetical protein [Spirochaetota bacterium]
RILMTPYVAYDKYIFIGTDEKIYILNEWGLLYTDYTIPLTSFTVQGLEKICFCSRDGYLYNVNLLWLTKGLKKEVSFDTH